jgi:hypothetical protein
MNDVEIVAVPAKITTRESYNTIIAALNALLHKWHPDHNTDPRAEEVTRKILATKRQAERVYRETQ